MGKDKQVKFTVTLENVRTIYANPTPEQRARNAMVDQSWKDATRKKQELFHQRAAGRKLLRIWSPIGPCMIQGIVLRETANFYVYAEDAHFRDGPIETFPLRKKQKDLAHVESCRCCEDHSNTSYPMGYDN